MRVITVKRNEITLKKVYFQCTSSVDNGTQLELIPADENGKELDIGTYILCRFISKKKDEILFEIYINEKIVQFPIEELEKAITTAKDWVKDESSFNS